MEYSTVETSAIASHFLHNIVFLYFVDSSHNVKYLLLDFLSTVAEVANDKYTKQGEKNKTKETAALL